MFYVYSVRDREGTFAIIRQEPMPEGVTESGTHEIRLLEDTPDPAAANARAEELRARVRAPRARLALAPPP